MRARQIGHSQEVELTTNYIAAWKGPYEATSGLWSWGALDSAFLTFICPCRIMFACVYSAQIPSCVADEEEEEEE